MENAVLTSELGIESQDNSNVSLTSPYYNKCGDKESHAPRGGEVKQNAAVHTTMVCL